MPGVHFTIALSVAAAAFAQIAVAGTLQAGESNTVEKAAPQALGTEDFKALLESSPFTRPLNQPKTLLLTGAAMMDGKPVATIIDFDAGHSMVISDRPNELGWSLVEVQGMEDLDSAVAIIAMKGGQTIRAYHDEKRIREARSRLRFVGGPAAHHFSTKILPEWIHDLDPVLKGLAIQNFIERGGFNQAPFQAVDMALAVPEPQARGPAVSAAFGKLGGGVNGIEIADAVNRLNAIPVGRDRDFAINGLAHGLVGRDPKGALKWANSISNEGFRKLVVRNVSQRIEAQRRKGR